MPKYRVKFFREVHETFEETVEADTPEEAEREAEDISYNFDWDKEIFAHAAPEIVEVEDA